MVEFAKLVRCNGQDRHRHCIGLHIPVKSNCFILVYFHCTCRWFVSCALLHWRKQGFRCIIASTITYMATTSQVESTDAGWQPFLPNLHLDHCIQYSTSWLPSQSQRSLAKVKMQSLMLGAHLFVSRRPLSCHRQSGRNCSKKRRQDLISLWHWERVGGQLLGKSILR